MNNNLFEKSIGLYFITPSIIGYLKDMNCMLKRVYAEHGVFYVGTYMTILLYLFYVLSNK
jgi:hypothetical protein